MYYHNHRSIIGALPFYIVVVVVVVTGAVVVITLKRRKKDVYRRDICGFDIYIHKRTGKGLRLRGMILLSIHGVGIL